MHVFILVYCPFPIYARPSKTKLLLQDLIASNAIEAGREIAAAWMLFSIPTGVLPALEKSRPIVVEMLNQLSGGNLSDASAPGCASYLLL